MSFDRDKLSIIAENHYVYDALDSETLNILLAPRYFAGLPNNTIIIIGNDKVVNKLTLTIDATGTAKVAGSDNNNVVNVMDFGAVGDGVTNDTTAVNNAIAAANAQGGGVVFFPYTELGYNFTYSLPPKGVRLEMDGAKDGITRQRFGGNASQKFQKGSHEFLDGPHTDHRKVHNYMRIIAEGSTLNGPAASDIAQEIHLEKQNYLTTQVAGEIVGQYVFIRQGGPTTGEKSDGMARLLDIQALDGCGFIGLEECAVTNVDSNGNILRRIVVQNGVLNSRDGDHFGKLLDAITGTNDRAVYIRDSNGSNTGEWGAALTVERAQTINSQLDMAGNFFALGNIGAGLATPQARLHSLNTSAGISTVGLILSNASTTTNTSSRLVFNLSTSLSTESCFIEGVRTNSPASSAALINFRTSDGSANHEVKITEQGKIRFESVITAGGTTGNRTINKPTGSVNIAAGQSSITVTNNTVSTTSLVFATIATNDATAVLKNVVVSSGSFVINLNTAATAETRINFMVIN